ncbi:MAG: MORN variant repeat-containing protein [Bacteroidetes bacterium]|nr:MAG: MORN variant repeat-containing protein [Bacteroidota bacterium]
MKKFTLILLFIVCKVGLAQSYEIYNNDTINFVDVNGLRQGKWIIWGKMKKDPAFKDDQKVEEGNYKDSKKIGKWLEYHPNGNKKSDITYENNRPNGYAIMYYANGQKSEEGVWKGNRWVGDYKLYYEDGKTRQEFKFNPTGQREGTQKYYHPNGQLAIEGNWNGGKEEGTVTEFYEDGTKKSEKVFAGGTMDAAKTKTYPPKNGVATVTLTPEEKKMAKEESKAIDPKLEKPNKGEFKGTGNHTLYRNGQVTKKGYFENNRLKNGEERIYENGLLIQIRKYEEFKWVGDLPLPVEDTKAGQKKSK